MPNEYSIAIHEHLSQLMETARSRLHTIRATGDASAESYCRGQLDELDWIRDYLKQNSDLDGFTYS